ncbi:hypothetical protein BJ508DRAFT_304032 [Ascobolus immersus RN42]|uniref:Uncharacterized protein n=1 Tax=Ascobolus immersus RN42 TaxID=1160509 RepID=A0A3N4IJ80_ASCIM|nr:hypothetical protein BJ508DRAFT_304032 [Ascobolus immersus RN42]
MASFLTLPFELHVEIASYFLPSPPPTLSTPMLVCTAMRQDDPEDEECRPIFEAHAVFDSSYKYFQKGSYKDILRLILAFGRGPTKNEPNNNAIGQSLRHIYTAQLSAALAKSLVTQVLYYNAHGIDETDPRRVYYVKKGLWDILTVFDFMLGESSSTSRYDIIRLEFDFWRSFVSVCDDVAHRIPLALGWEEEMVKDAWAGHLEGLAFDVTSLGKRESSRGRAGLIAALVEREIRQMALCEDCLSETSRARTTYAICNALISRYRQFGRPSPSGYTYIGWCRKSSARKAREHVMRLLDEATFTGF